MKYSIKTIEFLAEQQSPDFSNIISDPTTNEIVYVIPVSIMWDSTNVVSENVTMFLAELGNGKYMLTITADT